VNVDGSVFEVDRAILPAQDPQFTVTGKEVDRERHSEAPAERHVLALDKLEELGRVEEWLASGISSVRPLNVGARIVRAHPELIELGGRVCSRSLRE
jgi:hypothetical protein